MEGCAREVRGGGEEGKQGEKHDNGRQDNDYHAMMMNDEDAALPSP
jgi:hypothetical protein